jgi:hypothetical protein
MRAGIPSVLLIAAALGPATAQPLQLPPVIEIDCAGFQRQPDGAWTVVTSNTILLDGKVSRVIFAGDNPVTTRMPGGRSLGEYLDSVCGRYSPLR